MTAATTLSATDAVQPDEKLAQLTARVQTLRNAAVDALSDTRNISMEVAQGDDNVPLAQRVRFVARSSDGPIPVAIMPEAHQQVAAKVAIDKRYYDRMLNEAPELLTTNVNHWLNREPETRLLRMVKPIGDPGEAELYGPVQAPLAMRAFLSDRYRPLDNGALLDTVLPVAAQHGARVAEWSLDLRRMHVRFVGIERDAHEVVREVLERNPNQPRHAVTLHEVISQGLALRNSETGHAALSVQPLVQILRCINMLVVNEAKRVAHLGRRNEADDEWMNPDTRRLDDAATFLKVRDKVIEILSPSTMERATMKLMEANGTPLPLPATIPAMEFLGNLGASFDLNQAETDLLREEFLNERVATNSTSVFTLSQAVTATARRVKDDDYERGTELEALGWKVLDEPVSKLLKAGGAK